ERGKSSLRSASKTRASEYQEAGSCGDACRSLAAVARSDMAQPFQQKINQPDENGRQNMEKRLQRRGSAGVECVLCSLLQTVLLSRPREGFRGRPRRQNVLVYEGVRAWVKPLKLLAKTAKPTRGWRSG